MDLTCECDMSWALHLQQDSPNSQVPSGQILTRNKERLQQSPQLADKGGIAVMGHMGGIKADVKKKKANLFSRKATE